MNFWELPLSQLSAPQWEALCDGCGKCCLSKLEDWDTGEILFTNVACRLLDGDSCRCRDYDNRKVIVPECVKVTKRNVTKLGYLPPSCAYRLRSLGKPLPWWHHLVCGDPEMVHRTGFSARGRTVPEILVDEEDLPRHIIDWATLEP